MERVYREALSETEYVLNFLGEERQSKIPIKLRNLIKEEKSRDYIPRFDVNKPANQQNISREAVALLAYIYRKYLDN